MATADNSTRLAILVAEDDLLASDVQDAIRSFGHACLGPVGSLSEVLRLIAAAHVDAAILDISLRHGERVYPAADLLAARDIPFAFVTAYRSTHLDQRYAGTPACTVQ